MNSYIKAANAERELAAELTRLLGTPHPRTGSQPQGTIQASP